ncbi:MAG: hypothetical protein SFU91_04305 [Chloroherpetonaceae bacterium]|nr:hypothetical protein [Chloroherpetonaceae bacterium]
MSQALMSPRWLRLVKVEEIETDVYFIDLYVSPLPAAELISQHLSENPVLYAFAVFNKENKYLLSYALEIRETSRLLDSGEEETYIGYFLETYCEHKQFSCKNFKETTPTLETVRAFVLSLVNEYDAIPKMINYDQESAKRDIVQDSDEGE